MFLLKKPSRYVSLMAATGFSPLRYPHFLPELLRGGISNNILIISNILRCFFRIFQSFELVMHNNKDVLGRVYAPPLQKVHYHINHIAKLSGSQIKS